MEPLSTCAARGCAPRTCEVADKPRMRRVSALRPGCASGVVWFERHLARATEQHHLRLRPGVQAAVRTGVFRAYARLAWRLPSDVFPHVFP